MFMKQPLLLSILIFLFLIPCAAQKDLQNVTSNQQAQKWTHFEMNYLTNFGLQKKNEN